MKKLLSRGNSVDSQLLLWCQENAITDADELERCLKHTSAYKLIRYLQKQSQDEYFLTRAHYQSTAERFAFGLYKDYIRFCEDLDYDLTDDFILFPRHLKDAHDRVSEMFSNRKAEIYNQKIAAAYESCVKQYQLTKYGLTVVPPKTAAEIVEEGHALHHCVGGYVSRVANKECVILFLRKKEEPDKPFYTIEVIVRRIMEEKVDKKEPTEAKYEPVRRAVKSEQIDFGDAADLLGEDSIATIKNTMASFRR